jgi:signal peptidase I
MVFTDKNGKATQLKAGDVVKLKDGRVVKLTYINPLDFPEMTPIANFTVLNAQNLTRDIDIQEPNVLQIDDIVEVVKLVWSLWRILKKFFGK